MKLFFYFTIFLILVSCGTSRGVYWCGDHPCVNKKEKEAYFRKNMVVEVRELKKDFFKKNSEIEKIIKQAKLGEKDRIKEEKDLAKQAKLEEKNKNAMPQRCMGPNTLQSEITKQGPN